MNGRRRATIAAGLATAATLALSGAVTPMAAADRASTAPDAVPRGGRTVYVTNSARDGGDPNVARFAINNAGTLNPVDTARGGRGAHGMVFTPDLRYAYLAAPDVDQIHMYRIRPDGSLNPFGAVETPGPGAIAIAPNGRTIYVSNADTRMVSVFAVRSDGGLAARGAVDTGAEAAKVIAVTPDGRFLYVSHGLPTDTKPSVLTGFALGPDGSVGREVARATIGISGSGTVITPNGRFVYVVNQASNDMHGFRIGGDGSLTPVPGSPVDGGDFPGGAAVSPDGRRLYVSALGVENGDIAFPGQVLGFTIGNDGRLTENIDRVDMTSPTGIGFTPDSRRMYVSDYTDSIVNTFIVAPDGNLTLIQTLPSGGPQPAFHSVNVLPTRSERTPR
ncbi:MAG: beta-propeller fold lactonase family protein [Streptosporangiales bacterium]|nr:beta-propeller fold lactonase family protein [Streptosporangiales bacterium]